MSIRCKVTIIGGGLAGLVAAYHLAERNINSILIDDSIPAAKGRLGGFAEFSGAKFSFLPAGAGLIPVAGTRGKLVEATERVLSILGLNERLPSETSEIGSTFTAAELRSYKSIVLTPDEMRETISLVVSKIRHRCEIVHARVMRMKFLGDLWRIKCNTGEGLVSRAVIYAGGRTGGRLLSAAGAKSQEGKGIDVGVRIEFPDKSGLRHLRAIGPDAKVLSGRTRTFCLNHPGTVYRYPFDGYTIPGGVVASPEEQAANVGILLRLNNKRDILAQTADVAGSCGVRKYEISPLVLAYGMADKQDLVRNAWGDDVAKELQSFCALLGHEGLVDWSKPHRTHWPLLDWHWEVFGLPGSTRTTVPLLHVAGDSSGHARGLLQAAIGGWLAAEALIDEIE